MQTFGNPAKAVDDLSRDEYQADRDLKAALNDPALAEHLPRLQARLAHLTSHRKDAERPRDEQIAKEKAAKDAADRQERQRRRTALHARLDALAAARLAAAESLRAETERSRARHDAAIETIGAESATVRAELSAIEGD